MSDEVELKFDVEPASVAPIRATPILAAAAAQSHDSESLYFDTKDGALRRSGVSLRVRRSGGRNVQTAKRKRGSAAGLFVREEWEAEVPRFDLDLGAFQPALVRRLLGKAERDALKPLVRTRFTRTSWQVEIRGSLIEVVLDEGTVSARRRQAPFTELELELKRGKPAALFALAEEIGRAAPLRLGMMSKNERGYALVEGRLGRPAKADAVRLDPGMSEADAFRTIAYTCLRQFRLNEIALLRARDPDALHQARVALRRLRSALSLFRHAVKGKDYQALREELRWFAGQFGEARNFDVLLAGEDWPLFAEGGQARARLHAEREAAYDRVMAAIESERARTLLLRLALWLELGSWRFKPRAEANVRALAAHQLERQWRKARRRGAELGSLDADAEHQLRIDIKKLRYAAEFLAGLHAGRAEAARASRFVSALKQLQEQLGIANDHRTAEAVAARLAPGETLAPAPAVPRKAAEKAFRRASATAGYWLE
ncbi:MAG: inorganic triphosphatase [Sphingomonadaceae bacterium]|nr:inorganic triphosphatase [Sphingomonadaceae bacterium]